MLSVLGVVALLSAQFDPKALGSARANFPPCSEPIRASEMGSAVYFFPVGRGTLRYYLAQAGYRPKSKLTALMTRDLQSKIPLAGYFFEPMGDQAFHWTVTPSSMTKETLTSWDADSRSHTPFPIGADEIRLIEKAKS